MQIDLAIIKAAIDLQVDFAVEKKEKNFQTSLIKIGELRMLCLGIYHQCIEANMNDELIGEVLKMKEKTNTVYNQWLEEKILLETEKEHN